MSDALVALRDAPLSVDEVVDHVRHLGAGGICVFLGTVRDHSDGAAVQGLEYQAYASMALAEMRRIADEVAMQVEGVRLGLVHRLGSLEIGEVAVVCAASAPHRAEAYRACRMLIDMTKARVPIWKKERTEEGAQWVDWVDTRERKGGSPT
jgi:molybdopterin synthase catalytic subunit